MLRNDTVAVEALDADHVAATPTTCAAVVSMAVDAVISVIACEAVPLAAGTSVCVPTATSVPAAPTVRIAISASPAKMLLFATSVAVPTRTAVPVRPPMNRRISSVSVPLVEVAMLRYKVLIGRSLRAQTLLAQKAEAKAAKEEKKEEKKARHKAAKEAKKDAKAEVKAEGAKVEKKAPEAK